MVLTAPARRARTETSSTSESTCSLCGSVTFAPSTSAVQNILNDLHTAVMSESTPIADAITEAETRASSEAGIG